MKATIDYRRLAAYARGYQAATAYWRPDKTLDSFLRVFRNPLWSHWAPQEERDAFLLAFRERYESLTVGSGLRGKGD